MRWDQARWWGIHWTCFIFCLVFKLPILSQEDRDRNDQDKVAWNEVSKIWKRAICRREVCTKIFLEMSLGDYNAVFVHINDSHGFLSQSGLAQHVCDFCKEHCWSHGFCTNHFKWGWCFEARISTHIPVDVYFVGVMTECQLPAFHLCMFRCCWARSHRAPLTSECRPENGARQIHFAAPDVDEVHDDMELDEDDPTVNDYVAMPRWHETRHLVEGLEVSEDNPLVLISFGLRDISLGRRDGRLTSVDPAHLQSVLWGLWQDMVPQFDDCRAFFVTPQPLVELGIGRAIVMIVEIKPLALQMVRHVTLRLTAASWSHILLQEPEAIYLPSIVSHQWLCQQHSWARWCHPHGFRQCIVDYGGHRVIAGPGFPTDGALLKFCVQRWHLTEYNSAPGARMFSCLAFQNDSASESCRLSCRETPTMGCLKNPETGTL